MGLLQDWVNQNADYISIKDGDSFVGIYQGWSMGEMYKNTQMINYHFEKDGKLKDFSSGSKKLASKLDKVPKGTTLKIMRFGNSTETKFEVEVLKSAPSIIEQVDQKLEDQGIKDVADAVGGEVTLDE